MSKQPLSQSFSLVLLASFVLLAAFHASSAATDLQLIELDDFSTSKSISNKALKILSVTLNQASRDSVIDESKLNNELRISLRESGLFKQILEPWHDRKEVITVEIVANERDLVAKHNNKFQFYLDRGLEIPLPGNHPTYNLDGELKITLRFDVSSVAFEFSCWTTSDFDMWRGDFSVAPKLGQRLVADCNDELVTKMKANPAFIRAISSP